MYRFGMDYYPEHWPRERWERDAQLMQDAGVNIVRLAEFAWSYLEPSDGKFEFEWIDTALSILGRHNIQAVLGTPTAAPPPWLMALLPDAYRVRVNKHRAEFGGRREYCPSHRGFIERCRNVVTAMAQHYADHPGVIGWQIDNEFSKLCYCRTCYVAFQSWLKAKYGTLESLNEAWGTIFWSHVFSDWSQVPVPEDDGYENSYGPNPGQQLDYRRFSSDAVVRFQQEQLDILRRLCPGQFVTHNTGFGLDVLNFFDVAAPLDFISLDHYPRSFEHLTRDVDPSKAAFFFDRVRGLKRQNYWMTEAQSGTGGWTTLGMAPRPGELRLWSYQAIARGADAMIYFRWRSALFGEEQYWHGVLDHHGEPGRRYAEIQQVGQELGRVGGDLLGATTKAEAAILLSYDSLYAFQHQPNHPQFDYLKLVSDIHAYLHRRNIPVDVIRVTDDLSQYRLVIAPALYVVSQAEADNLTEYVNGGGMLLLTARSGVKDVSNSVVEVPLPGLLADICGVQVEEYDVLPDGMAVPLSLDAQVADEATGLEATLWCDVLSPTTARTLATYEDQFYTGRSAVTLNEYGSGQVLYLGTLGDARLVATMVELAANQAGLQPALDTPEGVEATERWKNDVRFLFVLNHCDTNQMINLPEPLVDILTGEHLAGDIKLSAKSVLILRGS